MIHEEHYAPIYILFREEDIAWLCERCHNLAHRLYHKIINRFWEEVGSILRQHPKYTLHDAHDLKVVREVVSLEICESYRLACIKTFEEWHIKFKKRKKK